LALGAVFNETKEYPQAETALLRGLALKPDAPAGHYELAKTYWFLGRWQEAAPHARKAVSAMPDVASPHALLGNILLREQDAQGALDEYHDTCGSSHLAQWPPLCVRSSKNSRKPYILNKIRLPILFLSVL